MINACALGFSTENDGIKNTEVLNRLLSENSDVLVAFPGVYRLTGPVILSSGNHLRFCTGATVLRENCPDNDNGNLFINRGAYTAIPDEDISLVGLHLITDGVSHRSPTAGGTRSILGLRGHVAFLYVRRLYISDFLVTDLTAMDYAIQISDFEDVTVDNVQAEGMKDGVHFGPGKRFVLKNCRFRTYDDDIALNCADYSVSNPNFGTIEDGIIENVVDLPGLPTESMFLRILVGTPRLWEKGMTVYHSDAVVHDGKLYRVAMNTDNTPYVSDNPPTHEHGMAVVDGIRWFRTNYATPKDELLLPAECRNIVCKDVFLEQKRNIAVMVYTDYSEFLKSYHAGSTMPKVEGLSFENVQVLKPVEHFLYVGTPLTDLSFKDCHLGSADVQLEQNPRMPAYPDPDMTVLGENVKVSRKG